MPTCKQCKIGGIKCAGKVYIQSRATICLKQDQTKMLVLTWFISNEGLFIQQIYHKELMTNHQGYKQH